jgi:hypothetical protein
MKHNPDTFDAQLDRLVDGELSSDEYRDLLAGLELEPQGWRRCALAFLESQSLRQELAEFRREIASPAPSKPVVAASHAKERSNSRGRFVAMLAVAASLLLAIGATSLLWNARSLWRGTPQVVNKPVTEDESPAEENVADEIAADGSLGNLAFSLDGNAIELPVYHVDSAAELLTANSAPVLPQETIRALAQQGRRVLRRRTVMPIELEDGGRVLVPIDRYRITPVSSRGFQ